MKTGQWPATCVCQVGVLKGGDTGEFGPATAGSLSTHPFLVVTERDAAGGKGCGSWGCGRGTLLGPEGTAVRLLSWQDRTRSALNRRQPP